MHNVVILATLNLFLHRKNKKLRQNIETNQQDAVKRLVSKIFSDGEKSEQERKTHTTV